LPESSCPSWDTIEDYMDGLPEELKLHWLGKVGISVPAQRAGVLSDTLCYEGSFELFKPARNRFIDDALFAEFAETEGLAPPVGYDRVHMSFDGLYTSIAKYNGPNIQPEHDTGVDQSAFNMAVAWTMEHFRGALNSREQWSLDKVAEEVDMSRSPGFPWNRAYGTAEEAFDAHRDYVAIFDARVRAGERPVTLWNYFAKEEILPDEKILAGKVRSISGCALEFKFVANRIFLPQNLEFYKHHRTTWSKVGVNPFNLGWHELYSKLTRGGLFTRGFSADISAYDASFQFFVAEAVYKVRWLSLDPELRSDPEVANVFRYVLENIYRGRGVGPLGELFSKDHGNNSGSSNTVTDNTIAQYLSWCYVWIRCCIELGIVPTFEQFHREVEGALYGDDGTLCGSALAESILTVERMQRYWKELGWTVKFSIDGAWGGISDLEFISKRFQFVGVNKLCVPVPVDGAKALCSLYHKSRGGPEDAYRRACGLLNVYWYCKETRVVVERYLNWLETSYFPDPVVHRQIRSARLSPSALTALYLSPYLQWGLESSG